MPRAVSRCLGFHRIVWGKDPAVLGTQELLPCGSTERPVAWDMCQRECSAGRKLLRLSLSCLLSVSRTRLFWKRAVEKCPQREEGKEGESGCRCSGRGQQLHPRALGSPSNFSSLLHLGPDQASAEPCCSWLSPLPESGEKSRETLFPNNCKCIVRISVI